MWDYRFSMQVAHDCSDRDLLFVRQLGIERVYLWLPEEKHNLSDVRALKQRIEDNGLMLHNVLSGRVAKHPSIHLGLPDRDRAIGQFADFLHLLREADIRNTTFTWEPDQVWSTGGDGASRYSPSRYVVSEDLAARAYTHERLYTREELWDNFEHFMKEIIPVAEETGVRLALHPNDPPVDFPMGGVPALIRSYNDYKKAFSIAASKALGMEFCCGCWLEGGKAFGDILKGLEECVKDDRVIIVHFRNIDKPLPDFTETYLDNGYFSMYDIMKVLCDANYQGAITLDHTPAMADGPEKFAPRAYAIGYMRALAERAVAERK